MKDRSYALAFAILCLLSAPICAQKSTGGKGGNTGSIGGTTTSSPSFPNVGTTNPKAQVTVEVRVDGKELVQSPVMVDVLLMGTPVAHSHTDSSGQVTFNDLSTGSYTANVSGPGIQPTSVSFTVDFAGAQRVLASVQRDQQAEEHAPAGLIDASELSAPKKAHQEYEKGMREYKAQHFDKAEQHFRNAVKEYPKYSSAWNSLGSIRIRENDIAGGEDCFRHALEANPNNVYAARNLARLLIDKHNPKEAEELMKRAVLADPNNPESLTILAYAELQNGEFDDAIATAKRVHTGPTHSGALSHLIAAKALEAKQQNFAAIAEYKLFLKEAPDSPQASVAQQALSRLGANQEASR
ncbi:MAG TPA: tetratricopeptide repeat protein [candidate division Zixibacteria bacterium]|nr:tetratricopeptide repeat protein [candidate division Zixibacteria bacterium]